MLTPCSIGTNILDTIIAQYQQRLQNASQNISLVFAQDRFSFCVCVKPKRNRPSQNLPATGGEL